MNAIIVNLRKMKNQAGISYLSLPPDLLHPLSTKEELFEIVKLTRNPCSEDSETAATLSGQSTVILQDGPATKTSEKVNVVADATDARNLAIILRSKCYNVIKFPC